MARKIHILVVDDAAFTRDLIKKGIRTVFPSFALDEAIDGKQAQGRIAKHHYDLILCDWEMPNVTGDELLHWVRNESTQREVPFIMVTSRGDKEHVVKAMELGVTNYLSKPFTTDKLINILALALMKSTGLNADQLKSLGTDAKGGLVNQSGSVILEAQEKAATRRAAQAKVLGGDSTHIGLSGAVPIAGVIDSNETAPVEKRRSASVHKDPEIMKKAVAQIRFRDQKMNCLVTEISSASAKFITKHDGQFPALLEPVAFDFDNVDGAGVSRLNAYTQALAARDESPDSEYAYITVRFIDEDREKLDELQRFVDLLTG